MAQSSRSHRSNHSANLFWQAYRAKFDDIKVRCEFCGDIYRGSFFGKRCFKCNHRSRKTRNYAIALSALFPPMALLIGLAWAGQSWRLSTAALCAGVAGAITYLTFASAFGLFV